MKIWKKVFKIQKLQEFEDSNKTSKIQRNLSNRIFRRRELPKFKESDFKENFNKETFPFLPLPELIQSTRFSNINLQTRLYYKRKVVKTRVIELININDENGTIGKILMNWLKIEFSKWLEKFVINSIVKIIIIINLEMSIDRNESIRVNNLRGNCKWNENNLSSWLVVSLREFHNILWLDTCWKPAGRPCCPKPLNYGSLPGAKLNTRFWLRGYNEYFEYRF